MSIQSIQVFKEQEVRVNKKGKKIVIMGFGDVKQFLFQEDVWKLIKEYMLDDTRFIFDVLSRHRRAVEVWWESKECIKMFGDKSKDFMNFSDKNNLWINVYFQIKYQFEPFVRKWFKRAIEVNTEYLERGAEEQLQDIQQLQTMILWDNLENMWSRLDELEERFKYYGGVITRVFLEDLFWQRQRNNFEKCVYPIPELDF